MPLLNHWFPQAFVSREYEGAREQVCDPSVHAEIRAAYDLWDGPESKRVFLTKLNHFLDFDKAHIEAIRSTDPIYFERDLVALTDHEIFADCGGFTGDTFRSFADLGGGKFKRYYAFEPDKMLWERLRAETSELAERVEIVQAGVGEKSGDLSFVNTGKGDGRIVEGKVEGAVIIPITTLDEFFADREPPTFIKMDIEGFEVSALRGARKLIQAHAPLLAFSIYHRPSELWQLPLMVRDLNPQYRFHIRHYTHETDDTVCYAIPPGR
jgi:FkbM family methyltransferase